MEIFKKKQDNTESPSGALGILFGSKQFGHLISAIILLVFFAFVAGYYWGKKSTFSEIKDTLEIETVADKISYSLVINSTNNI